MGKKLLLAAVTTFLLITLIVALDSEDSLAAGRHYYFGTVMTAFIYLCPVLIALVVWEHNSSRSLRYFSAGVGLIATLVLVWFLKIDVLKAEQVLILLYVFFLISGFSSALCRLSVRLLRLVRYLALRLKTLGRALPSSSPRRNSQYT